MSRRPAWRRGGAMLLVLAALALATSGANCEAEQEPGLTIVLVEYRGPEAPKFGKQVADDLTGKGLKDVFVVEGPDVTSVCVGHFKDYKDPAADQTMQVVRGIQDPMGQRPFAGVLLVPMPEASPKNAWPLESAPGLFTLHIASWEAPGRCAAAQAYAAALRARGDEAYVYHGPRLSMVTVGSFGPEVFDDISRVGRTGFKPEIVDPKALALIQKFPRMRLEGQDTPVATGLVKIPGRELPAPAPQSTVPGTGTTYRVALAIVSTQTGRVPPKGEVSGLAQARQDVATLAQALAQQLLAALPKGQAARVGVAGILATDADAIREKADQMVSEALVTGLTQGAPDGVLVSDTAATARILTAGNLKVVDVLRDSSRALGLHDFDFIVVGTVTIFPGK